jgi:hypothetical protein
MTNVASFLGKPIDDICGNGFDDHGDNHCAHFVSHVLRLAFGVTCRQLTGGTQAAANVRVQEVFAKCPQVGNWPPPAGSEPVLMFVTKATNVNLATKTMRNVPKKHIGIFEGGKVFNYSNTQEKVVSQTVPAFKTAFNAAYGGPQGYFWGTFPSSGALQAMAPARMSRRGKAKKTKVKKTKARKAKAKKTNARKTKARKTKARKTKATRKSKKAK